MANQMTKAALLDRIKAAHAALEASFADLSDTQMTEGGLDGGWAVKDALAHLAWWEQHMIQFVQAAKRGEQLPSLRQAGETQEDMISRVNAEVFTANQPSPLAEVLADKQQSYRDALALVESFTEDELAHPVRIEQVLGRPLQPYIAGDTYEHYEEHADAIKAWRGNP